MNNFNCVQSIIYVNFVIEIKLLLDVKKTNTEIKNVRNKIVKFYDQLFLNDNFKKITKKNFKKMKRRYCNAHDVIKKKTKIFWKNVTYRSMILFRNSKSVREKRWKISISTSIQKRKIIRIKSKMIRKKKKMILSQFQKFDNQKCRCVFVFFVIV